MAAYLFLFVFGHGVETSHLGDVSAQELCQASGDFSLEQVGIDVSAPCTHESTVTHLATIRPNMQEWRTQRHFVWCGVFLQCSEIQSDSIEIFQSQFRNPRISPFEFLSCTACWSKKQGAGMLTNNAKCIFCYNVTCFRTNKCCSTRSHLPGCFIKAPTSCLHGYSVSLRNIQGSSTCFWEAMFATRPIALAVPIHRLPWKEFKNALFSF